MGWYDDSLGYDVLGYDESGQVVVAPRGPGNAPGPYNRPGGPPQRPMLPGGPGLMRPGRPMGPLPLGAPLMGPPQWRGPVMTPGVMTPYEGLVPLQLQPDANAGVLTAAVPVINFVGRPQKPFRGQRVVAVINASAGAGAVQPRILGGIFVGTDLQAASRGDTPLAVFAQTAFGVELVLAPSGPGIEVNIQVGSVPAVPGAESVAIAITILGRYIA